MKYFGTDGIRGIVGVTLTDDLAYRVGLALSSVFGRGDYVIGRDSRLSGEKLEKAVAKGIADGGSNALIVGIIPTPAVASLTKTQKAICGIMISASHNPPEYNGIKIFSSSGLKLTENEKLAVENALDAGVKRANASGKICCLLDAEQKYLDGILPFCQNLNGLKVSLDCAFGASYSVAKKAFNLAGAEVYCYCDSPCGEKINQDCGALHPEFLLEKMKQNGSKLGFCFDGDADRVVVVMNCEVLDGDSVLFNLTKSKYFKKKAVVGTQLSNLALENAVIENGLSFYRTPVGDKFISRRLTELGGGVGGEPSGHYIVHSAVNTGDGVLCALILAGIWYDGRTLSSPAKLSLIPQYSLSLPASKDKMYSKSVQDFIAQARRKLANYGRIIVRASGTEPKIRIMVETTDERLANELIKQFSEVINVP